MVHGPIFTYTCTLFAKDSNRLVARLAHLEDIETLVAILRVELVVNLHDLDHGDILRSLDAIQQLPEQLFDWHSA